MEPPCPLPPQGIHVWYTLESKDPEQELNARYLDMLAPEERTRHGRFVQEKDRRLYLLGKVLVRTVLSRYRPVAPAAWTFTSNRFGKPIVAQGPSVRFNLSHTEGLVACAVAQDFDVGIDVENVERSVNLDIARRFFAPAEVAFLEQLPEEQHQRTFFLFWTLKEAYIKARGMGLSLPLQQFAFGLENTLAPTIAFEPAMNEDPAAWRFFLLDVPSSAHQMALAVQCPTQLQIDVLVRPMPLGL